MDQLGAFKQLGKRLAPALARIAGVPRGAYTLSLIEAYIAALQGKGSGSGWDIDGEASAAARCIRGGDPIIVDVGANRGAWTLALNRRISHLRPMFLLVEPASELQDELHVLPVSRLTVVHAAVGDEEGEAMLVSDAPGSESASLYDRRDTYHDGARDRTSQRVRIRTVDSLLSEYDIRGVDFLKLDVEGHELAALRGAAGALDRGAVHAMSFEFGSTQLNSRTIFRDFWDMLTPLGYAIHRVLPGGRTVAIRRYYEDLEYYRGVSNYLAVLARK